MSDPTAAPEPVAVPILTLVLDVEGALEERVDTTVRSIVAQSCHTWELVVHGDGAADAARRCDDPRVHSGRSTGTVAARVGAALTSARGTWAAALTAGDRLIGSDALETIVRACRQVPGTDLVYADEVASEGSGDVETRRKPVWSPQRLLQENWVGRPAFVRTELVRELISEDLAARAWEHDLLLRVADRADVVQRVDVPLLTRPAPEPDASEDTAAVVRRRFERSGLAGSAVPHPSAGRCTVQRELPEHVSVAVVVPTDAQRGLAWGTRRWFAVEAVRSVLASTAHRRLEVVVPHTSGADPDALAALLALGDQVRLVEHDVPFSFAELANVGVLTTVADVVILLDQHSEVVSEAFVEHLVAPLLETRTGMTGPRVVDPDGRLADAGLALHQRRVQPMSAGVDPTGPDRDPVLDLTREVSGLGGLCLAMRRDTVHRVGGICQQQPDTFATDASCKIRWDGFDCVWVTGAVLRRLTPPQRTPHVTKESAAALHTRWRGPDLDDYEPSYGARQLERRLAEVRGDAPAQRPGQRPGQRRLVP